MGIVSTCSHAAPANRFRVSDPVLYAWQGITADLLSPGKAMPPPTNPKNDRRVVLRGFVRAESMVQIALALPISTVIGWALGDYLDHKLHQSWIAIAGLLVGVAAGFVQVIRLANQANRSDDV